MNILIVGGLLVLAVVAIVGAIMLGIGEERAEKQRKTESATSPMQTTESEATQTAKVERPTTILPSSASGIPSPPPSGDLGTTRQSIPALHKNKLLPVSQSGQLPDPISHEEEATTILRNEIHAMTGDLRVLVQRASDLEQRLSQLSEVLERQQHPQNNVPTRTPMPRSEEREEA
jgi:hypothetical protein